MRRVLGLVAVAALGAVIIMVASAGPLGSPSPSATHGAPSAGGAGGSPFASASPGASASASAPASPTSPPTTGLRATVPGAIDATCASDVSGAINAWIAGEPDGSTLVFPSGACYRLGGDLGIDLTGRNDLTLEGTGSRLELRTTGESNRSSAFFLERSDRIVIRGFTVDGGNAATGTTGAEAVVNERLNAAVVRAGCDGVEFDGVTWDRLFGFGPLLSADGGTDWPTRVSIHDSVIRGGEMGIGIVAARGVEIVGNRIEDSVFTAIDLEPDASQAGGGGFEDVLIADNDVTRYGWGQRLTSWFVAAVPQDPVLDTAVMDGLTITGNRVHAGAASDDNGNHDGIGGLAIRIDKANPKHGLVIADNWTADDDTQPPGQAVIRLANVEGLTVRDNRQPIARGAAFLRDAGTAGERVVEGNEVGPCPSSGCGPAPGS